PANVLIDNDGLVRITDFGIAVPATEAALHAHAGTPGYMAPEQLELGARLTERTDLYALGLLLYELLVGHDAFNAFRLSAEAQPSRPSTLVPTVNTRLERVVMQALARDPGERPATALDMAARLPKPANAKRGLAAPSGWLDGLKARRWLAVAGLAMLIAV